VAPPKQAEHWSLATLREEVIKIEAEVVRNGRYITFQMPEVAIPSALFAEILRLIDGLWPAPLPARQALIQTHRDCQQDRCVVRRLGYALIAPYGHRARILIAQSAR
jgi:hypothetical protein